MRKSVPYSFDKVYINCLEATKQLYYTIKKENISDGLITFKVGMSLWSWGETFTVRVTSNNSNETLVEVGSVSNQLIDWGKNNQNISDFMELLEKLLATKI